jgi:hypothetical protein
MKKLIPGILIMVFMQAGAAKASNITGLQGITLNSAIEGLNSIWGGIQEVYTGLISSTGTYNVDFDNDSATLGLSAVVDGDALALTYNGALSGTGGVTDLTWSGVWSGTLGSNSISASDSATYYFDPVAGGYTSLDFAQSGSINPPWWVRGAEVLGGVTIGIGVGVSTTNPWTGTNAGIGSTNGLLAISNWIYSPSAPPALPPTPPLPPAVPIPPEVRPGGQVIIISGGSSPTINKTLNVGAINTYTTGSGSCSPSSCSISGSINSTPVPGPIPLLGVGAAFSYSRKLRRRILVAKGK